eukprot:4391396-Amphidinium_carterae.1
MLLSAHPNLAVKTAISVASSCERCHCLVLCVLCKPVIKRSGTLAMCSWSLSCLTTMACCMLTVSVVTPSDEVCIEAMSSCVMLTMSLIGSLFCPPCVWVVV